MCYIFTFLSWESQQVIYKDVKVSSFPMDTDKKENKNRLSQVYDKLPIISHACMCISNITWIVSAYLCQTP